MSTYIILTNIYDHSPVIVDAEKIDMATLANLKQHTEFDCGGRHCKVTESHLEIVEKIAAARCPKAPAEKTRRGRKKKLYPDPTPELNHRIDFAANLYGVGWQAEKAFYEAIRARLHELEALKEKYSWKIGYPEEEGKYLVTYFEPQTGIDPDDAEMEIMTAEWDGVWHTDLDKPFAIMAWMELPDAWRGVKAK